MKVKKLDGYAPEYPAKSRITVKAGVIAAAAVLTAGAAIGCVGKPQVMGDFPADTGLPENTETVEETPYWMGEEAIDTASPAPDETLSTTGMPALSPDPDETLSTTGITLSPDPAENP